MGAGHWNMPRMIFFRQRLCTPSLHGHCTGSVAHSALVSIVEVGLRVKVFFIQLLDVERVFHSTAYILLNENINY